MIPLMRAETLSQRASVLTERTIRLKLRLVELETTGAIAIIPELKSVIINNLILKIIVRVKLFC